MSSRLAIEDPYYEAPAPQPRERGQSRGSFGEPLDPPQPQVVQCDCGHWQDEEDGAPVVSNGKLHCLQCQENGEVPCSQCEARGARFIEEAQLCLCRSCAAEHHSAATGAA